MEMSVSHLEKLRQRNVDGSFGRLILQPEIEPIDLPHHLVISGPSGTGKGTICQKLMPALKEKSTSPIELSLSWTSREQRPGEPDTAYRFVSVAEFEAKVDQGGFSEWTSFGGNYYGTPAADESAVTIYEIEVNGFAKMKERYQNDIRGIAILPPSARRLWLQLAQREDETELPKKLDRYAKFLGSEILEYEKLGYHKVINDRVDVALAAVMAASFGIYIGCTDGDDYERYIESMCSEGGEIYDAISRGSLDPYTLQAA